MLKRLAIHRCFVTQAAYTYVNDLPMQGRCSKAQLPRVESNYATELVYSAVAAVSTSTVV